MILSAVAAMASNRVIGVENGLPWDIPEDMKFFRDKTKGKIMIVGRKTFESFGKPLPGRYHLVITRQSDYKIDHPQVQVVPSLEVAIQEAKKLMGTWPEEVCVVGGGEIYKQSLPFLNRIYLTVIEKEFPGDTKFPEFDESVFKLKEKRDGSGPVPFSFRLYQKD
jgi:dihydrofolate reductase